MTFDIGTGIGEGVDQRVPHPGLRRQIDDPLDIGMGLRNRLHRVVVGNIRFDKGKAVQLIQFRQARTFQRRVIIVIDDVDADDPFAAFCQRPTRMKPNEAGNAGNEDSHRPTTLRILKFDRYNR